MISNVNIDSSWKLVLAQEFQKPYFLEIKNFLLKEKTSGYKVYPLGSNIFSAFNLTPFDSVKVVILGQDPYHGDGEAHGLSFSVQEGVRKPPSLKNIFKELESDCGISTPVSGDLSRWAKQGVLLLNSTLTVRKDTPNSHKDIGWQKFTDAAIFALSQRRQHLVFLLRGSYAQSKLPLIDTSRHLVIQSAHPSPFSCHRGFFGSHPFSKTNEYLVNNGISPISW